MNNELSERIAREIADKNAVYGDCFDCDEATMCVHAQAAVAAIISAHLPAQPSAVWDEVVNVLKLYADPEAYSAAGDDMEHGVHRKYIAATCHPRAPAARVLSLVEAARDATLSPSAWQGMTEIHNCDKCDLCEDHHA